MPPAPPRQEFSERKQPLHRGSWPVIEVRIVFEPAVSLMGHGLITLLTDIHLKYQIH